MANPLDWAARAILQINGMSPEEITRKARQVRKQAPKKPLPKANTSAPQPEKKAPVERRTRIQGRIRPGGGNRSTQAGQAKPVRQGPRTANVKQQVELSPRSAQKPDGPIGPNSRYTPKSQQKPDGKAPSKTVRKLQQAAKTEPKSAAPKPASPNVRTLQAAAKKSKGIKTPNPSTRPGPGTSSRPLGTADVGPKGDVGKLGQRTGMKGSTPKPQLNAPKPGVKAPAPGSTQVKGQTNLFNAKGQPRDFRNPKVSANRPPTTTPVKHEPPKQLNPKPQRPAAPGQGSLFGENPKAKPGGNYKAPSVPKPGSATKPPAPKPAAPKVSPGDAAAARAVRATNLGRRLSVGRLSGAATVLGVANAIDDSRLSEAQKAKKYEVVDPGRKDRVVDNLLNGGPKPKNPPKPKPKPDTSKSGKAASTANYQRPKANVSKPTAARKAAQERDYKKLKDFG